MFDENNNKEGIIYFKDVTDDKIRAWNEFTKTELYEFMRVLFDTRVKVFSSLATSDERYYKEPMELASLQGKIAGIRSVMEGFFGALRTEYKRRLARAAAPKSNG